MALKKLTAVSPDPLLKNAARSSEYGEAQKARLVHVNYVIDHLTLAAYNDNAAAVAAGLEVGDLYQTTGLGAAPLDAAGIVMSVV